MEKMLILVDMCIVVSVVRLVVCVVGSLGLSDPCEKEPTDATDCLTNQEKEEVTASAQVCSIRLSHISRDF